MNIVHILLVIICITYSLIDATQTTCLIIHGTWAYSDWYKNEGDFYRTLKESPYAQNINIISFVWSGKNNKKSRLVAATDLVNTIQTFPTSTPLIIIAHSHGANVAILASQLMGQNKENKHTIERLYTLGAPVSSSLYFPNMHIIKNLYHFFSFNDFVQPVFGIFERQFPPHERIANIRLLIDNKEPHHSELRSPIVAHWFLAIHEDLNHRSIGNFEHFSFETPGIVYLYTEQPPLYTQDTHRAVDLYKDRRNLNHLRSYITRGHSVPMLSRLVPSQRDRVHH